MNLDHWLALIALILTYSSLLIGVYVRLMVKIKEIDMALTSLKEKQIIDISHLASIFDNFMVRSEKNDDLNIEAHEKVLTKIEEIKDSVNDIKVKCHSIKSSVL